MSVLGCGGGEEKWEGKENVGEEWGSVLRCGGK